MSVNSGDTADPVQPNHLPAQSIISDNETHQLQTLAHLLSELLADQQMGLEPTASPATAPTEATSNTDPEEGLDTIIDTEVLPGDPSEPRPNVATASTTAGGDAVDAEISSLPADGLAQSTGSQSEPEPVDTVAPTDPPAPAAVNTGVAQSTLAVTVPEANEAEALEQLQMLLFGAETANLRQENAQLRNRVDQLDIQLHETEQTLADLQEHLLRPERLTVLVQNIIAEAIESRSRQDPTAISYALRASLMPLVQE